MPDNTANASCGGCRYWEPGLGLEKGSGACHRFPPSPNPEGGKDWWPVTRANHWCGEFNAPMPCEVTV